MRRLAGAARAASDRRPDLAAARAMGGGVVAPLVLGERVENSCVVPVSVADLVWCRAHPPTSLIRSAGFSGLHNLGSFWAVGFMLVRASYTWARAIHDPRY